MRSNNPAKALEIHHRGERRETRKEDSRMTPKAPILKIVTNTEWLRFYEKRLNHITHLTTISYPIVHHVQDTRFKKSFQLLITPLRTHKCAQL